MEFDAPEEQLALPALQNVGNGHFRKFFSSPNAQAVIAQGEWDQHDRKINLAVGGKGGSGGRGEGGWGAGVAAAHCRCSSEFSWRPPGVAGMNHVCGTQ